MRYFAKTIQRKFLLILLIVGFVPAAAGILNIYWGSLSAIEYALGVRAQERAEVIAARVDELLGGCVKSTVATADAVTSGVELLEAFRQQAGSFAYVALLDSSGTVVRGARAGALSAASLSPAAALMPPPGRVALAETPTSGPVHYLLFVASVSAPRAGNLVCALETTRVTEAVAPLRMGDEFSAIFSRRGQVVGGTMPNEKLQTAMAGHYSRVRSGLAGWFQTGKGAPDARIIGFAAPRTLRAKQKEGLTTVDWVVVTGAPLHDITQLVAAYMWRNMFLGVALAGALLLLSVLLARGFIKPVRLLHDQVNRVAAGELEARVNLSTNDEIEDLATAFNNMAARLAESRSALAQQMEIVESKVRERTAELEQAHQRLLESERFAATGRLAANLAHEINNPLGIMKNYVRLLRDQLKDQSGSTAEALDVIGGELDRVARIVRNLLDFYRPSRARVVDVDLNHEVVTLLSLMDAGFRRRNIRTETNLDEALPAIPMSPDHIRQILINLLKNAEDAISGSGVIRIRTQVNDAGARREVVLSISDTGCGISPEDRARVFEPFFTTKSEGHGIGLGLSVTYGIVQTLGGTIDIDSTVGTGTTVTVRIPLRATPAAPLP